MFPSLSAILRALILAFFNLNLFPNSLCNRLLTSQRDHQKQSFASRELKIKVYKRKAPMFTVLLIALKGTS